MAKEGLPRAFNLKTQNALLRIEDVVLHHALEADTGGRITQHVWITAKAIPEIDRETLSTDIDFVLWEGETRLGTCSRHGLEFDADQEALDLVADDDLHIGQNKQIDRLELLMRVSTFHRFAGVDLDPGPFDPAEHVGKAD